MKVKIDLLFEIIDVSKESTFKLVDYFLVYSLLVYLL